MLAVETLPSLVKLGLVVETLLSVDILELVVWVMLSLVVLGLVVDTISSMVDSRMDVVAILVVLGGKVVVVRPERRAHFYVPVFSETLKVLQTGRKTSFHIDLFAQT